MGFPSGLVVKSLPGNAEFAGALGSILGSGTAADVENGNPSQDSCLENPMDRGAWWATYGPRGCERVRHD